MIMMKKNTEEEERKNRKREKNTERIKKRKMSLNRVVIRTEEWGLLAFNLTLDRLRFVFEILTYKKSYVGFATFVYYGKKVQEK